MAPQQQHQQPQSLMQQQNIWNEFNKQPPVVNYTAQIESVNAQQMKLREQISVSEKNLAAQHQVTAIAYSLILLFERLDSIWIF